jgi:hypothetical protein
MGAANRLLPSTKQLVNLVSIAANHKCAPSREQKISIAGFGRGILIVGLSRLKIALFRFHASF